MLEEQDERAWRKGKARLNRTVAAFIDRGIDNQLAASLQSAGWTLAKLQQQSEAALLKLGILPHSAVEIRSGTRPPIPFSTLGGVLIANRFTCCICRDPERGVVVHHINPWAQSHDHSPSNLAVVCLQHHDKAHQIGGLTQNLTSELLIAAKVKWETEVSKLDARAILDATAADSDVWWYFNHDRLFTLASDLGVNFRSLHGYPESRAARQIAPDGHLRGRSRASHWMYAGGDGTTMARYVSNVLRAVLEQVALYNVSDDLDRSLLSSVIRPGDLIFVQGSFYFKFDSDVKRGPGQNSLGARHANGVEITFSFDRWEATSNSPHSTWLIGHREASAILRVLSVVKGVGSLMITATSLAIGPAFDGMKTREYSNAPFRQGYSRMQDDNDAFEDDLETPWDDSVDNPDDDDLPSPDEN